VCACGCLIPAAILGGAVFLALRGHWIPAAFLLAAAGAFGWLGLRLFKRRQGRREI
jgi:CHASE2 domain-containing sensor protein